MYTGSREVCANETYRVDGTGEELGKWDGVQVTASALPSSKNVGHGMLIRWMSLLPSLPLQTILLLVQPRVQLSFQAAVLLLPLLHWKCTQGVLSA